MFVQINNKRIKISNVWESFYFDKEVEKDNVLKNLDNTLKVTAL